MRERILMEYCRVHVIDYVTKTLTRTGPMCCQSFKHSSHPKFRIPHASTLFKTLCMTTLCRILTPSVACGHTGFKEHNINHEPRLSAMFVARAEVNKHVLIPGACLHITMTQRDSRHSSHIQFLQLNRSPPTSSSGQGNAETSPLTSTDTRRLCGLQTPYAETTRLAYSWSP